MQMAVFCWLVKWKKILNISGVNPLSPRLNTALKYNGAFDQFHGSCIRPGCRELTAWLDPEQG